MDFRLYLISNPKVINFSFWQVGRKNCLNFIRTSKWNFVKIKTERFFYFFCEKLLVICLMRLCTERDDK